MADKAVKEDPEKTHQLLQRMNTSATQTIESMNDIVWAIKSGNDTLLHLVNRMRSYASEIEGTEEWDIQVQLDPTLSETPLDMMQRRNVYLVFKEAVNNAVKYSQGNAIDVGLSAGKHGIQMEIRDNGVGFDPQQAVENRHSFGGNGLKNMKMRAEELRGELTILSRPEEGTTVSLQFNPRRMSKFIGFKDFFSRK